MLTVAGADRVVTVDLHTGQIQGFFDFPVDHLTAVPVLADYLARERRAATSVIVVARRRRRQARPSASPTASDADTRVHRQAPAEGHAQRRGRDRGRRRGRRPHLRARRRHDRHRRHRRRRRRTCSSTAAPPRCWIAATHGVLSGPAVDRLKNAPIREVVVTNTVPIPDEKQLRQARRCCRSPRSSPRPSTPCSRTPASARSSAATTSRLRGRSASTSEPSGGHRLERPCVRHARHHPRRRAARPSSGSRPAGRLRRQGKVPAVVYGLGTDPVSVTVPARELQHILAGRERRQHADHPRGRRRRRAHARPADPAPPHAGQAGARRLRPRPPRRRGQRRGPAPPRSARPTGVRDGGLLEQLAVHAHRRGQAGQHPGRRSRSTSPRSRIGDQLRVGDIPLPDRRRRPRSSPTTVVAQVAAPRGRRRGRGRGRRGRRRRGRSRPRAARRRRRPRPRATPATSNRVLPASAPRHARRPAGRRARQPGRRVRAARATTSAPRSSSCWPRATAAKLRKGKERAARRRGAHRPASGSRSRSR